MQVFELTVAETLSFCNTCVTVGSSCAGRSGRVRASLASRIIGVVIAGLDATLHTLVRHYIKQLERAFVAFDVRNVHRHMILVISLFHVGYGVRTGALVMWNMI